MHWTSFIPIYGIFHGYDDPPENPTLAMAIGFGIYHFIWIILIFKFISF